MADSLKLKRPLKPKQIKDTAQATDGTDAITLYAATRTVEHRAVCQALRVEIDAAIPKAISKIWHAIPVWFIGENPVVGYNVTAKKGVNLLFWSGQSFHEPALEAVGKGTVRFPADRPLSAALVRKIVKARIAIGRF